MSTHHFNIKPTQSLAAILFVVLGFVSCNFHKEKPHRDNKLGRICIAETYGMEPGGMTVSVDSSLVYLFKEYEWSDDTTGVFYGAVSQGFWDTLNMEIESIPSKELDSAYEKRCDDCSIIDIYVNYNYRRMLAKNVNIDSFNTFRNVFYSILDSRKKIKMEPCFELTPRFPPPLPMPLIKELKVTPPDAGNSKRRHKTK